MRFLACRSLLKYALDPTKLMVNAQTGAKSQRSFFNASTILITRSFRADAGSYELQYVSWGPIMQLSHHLQSPYGSFLSTSQSFLENKAHVQCFASKAKKMPQNQLDEAHDLANAGKEEISQGSVKLSGDDHQVAIEDTVVEKAKKQTSKAVENLRKNFNREHQKVSSSDEGDSAKAHLNREAEHGRAAIRRTRQKLLQEIGKLERESELSSDEQHRLANSLQQEIDKAIAEVDELVENKIKELTAP